MEGLLGDFRKVEKKVASSASSTQEALDALIKTLHECRENLSSGESWQAGDGWREELLATLKEGSFDTLVKDASHNSYNAVSKFGKNVDAIVQPDISAACRGVEMDKETLNRVIAEHFFREGRFDLGTLFASESGVEGSEALKSPYQEMHRVLEALAKRRDVEPALDWAERNAARLGGEGHLEFMLHRLRFIQVLEGEGRRAAIEYARRHFPKFAARHLEDVQGMMGLLLWAGRLDEAPRKELAAGRLWEQAAEEVARQSCALLGQASESPLLVSVAAGAAVLPTLLKVVRTMGKGIDFKTCEQLPVELELGREYYFHSIFACPVSKDQSTKENPPMMLPCGHVLSRESLLTICKKETARTFKCPYCPQECRFKACKEITFPQVEAENLLQLRNHLHLGEGPLGGNGSTRSVQVPGSMDEGDGGSFSSAQEGEG